MEFLFRHLKVFRLHAILYDAAGAVRADSGKVPGYSYMIGRGPISCLLGHVTGLLFCLYVKLLLSSSFNSVDFSSNMSCIVLAGRWKHINNKELEVSNEGKALGYSFRPPKKYKPLKQALWCTTNLHRNVCNSGRLDYSEHSNILPRAVKGEYFAKRTEKCKILSNILDKEVEILENHGCPKLQDLVDEETWIWSSYPFRHRLTLHCAEPKAKFVGNWILRHLML